MHTHTLTPTHILRNYICQTRFSVGTDLTRDNILLHQRVTKMAKSQSFNRVKGEGFLNTQRQLSLRSVFCPAPLFQGWIGCNHKKTIKKLLSLKKKSAKYWSPNLTTLICWGKNFRGWEKGLLFPSTQSKERCSCFRSSAEISSAGAAWKRKEGLLYACRAVCNNNI